MVIRLTSAEDGCVVVQQRQPFRGRGLAASSWLSYWWPTAALQTVGRDQSSEAGSEHLRPRASKVLEQLSGQTPVFSKARYTVRSFGIRR
ncbi:Elongin-A [Castilleja foliolosa]|uniref:Elongin-A n=1 Tax=Castilleja foliolosa TaxID=1961234 RepID=A0ABD3CYE6_9LAMI